jgi:hypothetical protein
LTPQPNPLQTQAIEGLIEFAQKREHVFALLEGPAGSGKTFAVANMILRIQAEAPERKIMVATPTHKSKKVVLQALARYGISVNATTVSALIGKAPSTTDDPDDEGNPQWLRSDSGALEPDTLLIVDEVSMVGITDAKAIQKVVKRNNSQVIFSGDFAQLRPVKDASIQDAMEKVPVRFKLAEVMRSGSKGIVAVSKSVRVTGDIDLDAVDSQNVFIYNDSKKFEEAFVATEGAVAVAYTNKRVAELNHLKRKAIYGDKLKPFMPNETVILTEQPFFVRKNYGGKWESVKVADNNDQLVVLDSGIRCEDGNAFAEGYVHSTMLRLRNPETALEFEAKALTYDEYVNNLKPMLEEVLKNTRMFAKRLEAISRDDIGEISEAGLSDYFNEDERAWIIANASYKSNWVRPTLDGFKPVKGSWVSLKSLAFARDYFGFKGQFAVLLYEHASTAHKAQGSTYQHAFVDWPNLLTIRDADDRQAACYVAVSRAADTLHIRI